MAKIEIEKSLLKKAKEGNQVALMELFSQFVATDEKIVNVYYFGRYGLLWGDHSFACVTDKKVISLKTGSFNMILYQDAFLEDINSGVIYQPSLFMLYLVGFILCLTIIGFFLLSIWVKVFYTFNKSGLLWNVKNGISVYIFSNRHKINQVTEMWRIVSALREKKVKTNC
jgi:hypothetical protein